MKGIVMKSKKVNTIPGGVAIIVVIGFDILLTLVLGLILLPKIESIGLFIFTLIFLVALVRFLANRYWNFILVSKEGVCHGQDCYSWGDVFVTVKCRKPNFERNSFDYYAFFDDHFLTQEEAESKLIKKKGFYLVLTRKRVTWLLFNYNKKIIILNESAYRRNKDIITQIKSHNLKFVRKIYETF